ncbi:hypothetical protein [Citrobacter freundii]|uniref:hypothetical protein n=1 Tax=Citrobacter freundii TaxID=546 RepID=UPI0009BFFDFE|nr:hypothetical protein [Citrobacter freundii]EJC8216195.1 hypothetical protein [Citrobacter freundii]
MNTVTRLEWEACDAHNCHCDIVESKDGDMVNYEDYAALEKKLTDMALQLANAESKCRELAAENAALKALCEDRRMFIMNGVQLGYIQVPTVETDPALETIRAAVSPQESTPATDSFLAGVLAQGVEMAIVHIEQTICPNHETILNEFAAKLRKGAQS